MPEVVRLAKVLREGGKTEEGREESREEGKREREKQRHTIGTS